MGSSSLRAGAPRKTGVEWKGAKVFELNSES